MLEAIISQKGVWTSMDVRRRLYLFLADTSDRPLVSGRVIMVPFLLDYVARRALWGVLTI